MIEGKLADGGLAWTLRINGAPKGYWRDGSEARYFGCADAACDRLAQAPHFRMNP